MLTRYLIDKIFIDKSMGAIIFVGFETSGVEGSEVGVEFDGRRWVITNVKVYKID